ncbi:phytoene/squalene synthase family protein [Candidatus Zixiibacteriota bacterium]
MNHPLLADQRRGLDLEQAYAECAGITRKEARNFYYAFLPLRSDRRLALYALYSFARIADDLADEEGRELSERLAALDHLESRLDEALAGDPGGSVFTALADTIERFTVPVHTLRDLLTGVRQDQSVTRYHSYEELTTYCYHVAGTIGLMCSAVFGNRSEEAAAFAISQGLGMQLINIIRDVRTDADSDRIYIPGQLMAEYGVSEEDVFAGRTGEAWEGMMGALAGRARDALEEGRGLLPLIAPDARICPALMGDLYQKILSRIEGVHFDVFNHVPDLTLMMKLRLLGTAYWQYRIRRTPRIMKDVPQ